jgi:glycosyltransferase involved in cell wall biosynthesis
MQALWRLLPLAAQPWDELYLPAGKEAVAYLPAMALASRSVVVVERPPAEAAADLLRAASEVRCSSASLAQAASERGAESSAVRVAPPPPPDPDRFRPGDRPPSPRLRLVCTAPFHWSGGHDYLLVALRQLIDEGLDVSCAMVDDGPEPQRLLYTVVDLELADLGADGRPEGDVVTVHRHPSVPETADLLRQSDVFVLAAVEDRPWPEIAEALACGLPVVASGIPTIADARAGGELTVVPRRDPDALACAIASVATRVVRGAS